MNKMLIAAVVLVPVLASCKKTDKNEYEVAKPTIGLEKDTIHTPEINAGMTEKQVEVPKIEVKKETTTIKVPDIDVKRN